MTKIEKVEGKDIRDNDEEEGEVNPRDTEEMLSYCKLYSLGLGLLVGCFIQFSSLGANFILTILFGKPCEVVKNKIVAFSLGWSFFTSSMGILILILLVRCLVPTAWSTSLNSRRGSAMWQKYAIQKERNGNDDTPVILPEKALLYMECFFAFGALLGVCIAWTCTDLVLGFRAHMFHSLVTLVVAMVWCKVIACFFGLNDIKRESEVNNELSKPLLDETTDVIEPTSEDIVEIPKTPFKLSSLVLGLLVGCFIQLSSLGANFLISTRYGSAYNEKGITKEDVFWFSFGWSFFTSAMGIGVLFLLRSIITTSYNVVMKQSQTNNKLTDRLTLHLEYFFSFGALIGVNVSWIVTDVVLGLEMHIWHSFATLVLALVWCKVVSCCFGYSPDDDGDYEVEDEKVRIAPKINAEGLMVV